MLILDFPSGWYVLFAFALVLFAIFSYFRKSFSSVIRFGFIGLAVAVVSEIIAIYLGLWTYTNGNWPIILWPTYFLYTAAFYQLFNVLGKKRKR